MRRAGLDQGRMFRKREVVAAAVLVDDHVEFSEPRIILSAYSILNS